MCRGVTCNTTMLCPPSVLFCCRSRSSKCSSYGIIIISSSNSVTPSVRSHNHWTALQHTPCPHAVQCCSCS